MLTRLQRLFTPEERTRLARAQSARFSCHTFRPMDSRQFAALSLLCGRFSTSRAILEPVRVPLDFFGGSILGLGRVQGCDTVVQVLAGPQTSAHTEAGICAEALVLMLTDLGMATCYLTGGFRRDYLPDPPRSLDRVCVICAGTGLETQPARRRKSLDRLCQGDYATWPDMFRRAAEYVQTAPSSLNLQPFFMSVTPDSFGLDSSDRTRLDLGIGMVHAELAFDRAHVWRLSEDRRDPMSMAIFA